MNSSEMRDTVIVYCLLIVTSKANFGPVHKGEEAFVGMVRRMIEGTFTLAVLTRLLRFKQKI